MSSLAYIPFRVVYAPTAWVGSVVARLAAGYRNASPLERALILPAWALLRGVFLVGCGLAYFFIAPHAGRWRSSYPPTG